MMRGPRIAGCGRAESRKERKMPRCIRYLSAVLRVVAKGRDAPVMPCWWAAWTISIQKAHGLLKSP